MEAVFSSCPGSIRAIVSPKRLSEPLEQALSQLRDHWGYFEYEKKKQNKTISQLRNHWGYFEYENKNHNNLKVAIFCL